MTETSKPDMVDLTIRIDRGVAARMRALPEYERYALNIIGAGAMQEALIKLEHAARTRETDDE